jgi:hypothetical protein
MLNLATNCSSKEVSYEWASKSKPNFINTVISSSLSQPLSGFIASSVTERIN